MCLRTEKTDETPNGFLVRHGHAPALTIGHHNTPLQGANATTAREELHETIRPCSISDRRISRGRPPGLWSGRGCERRLAVHRPFESCGRYPWPVAIG